MPPEIPTSFPWWARFVAKHVGRGGDTLPPPTGFSSWEAYFISEGRTTMDFLPLGPVGGGSPTHAEGVKATLVWTRDGEDVATCSIAFVHQDGTSTTEVSDDDLDTLEGLLSTLWGDVKHNYGAEIALDRFEFHELGVGVRKPNPKRRETILTPAPGTGGSDDDQLPAQVALSVTFRTNKRKSWGRNYLPNPLFDESLVNKGRWTTALVDDVRDAYGTMFDGAAAANLPGVVWSPKHDGKALQFFAVSEGHPVSAHELELDNPDTSSIARTVDIVQVDDVPDVIRRRRIDRPLIRATHTLGA